MITTKPGEYDKMFPWREYMIKKNFDESLENMRPDMPEDIKAKLLEYLKENNGVGIW